MPLIKVEGNKLAGFDEKKVNKDLFKNTGIIAIGQLGAKAVSFLLLPIYTSYLTTVEYGTVDLLLTCSSVLTVFVGLQMNQAVFRFLATARNSDSEIRKICSSSFFIFVIEIFVYSVLFIIFSPLIRLDMKWFLYANVVMMCYLFLVSGIARGFGHNLLYACGNFISTITILVISVLSLLFYNAGIKGILVSYVIGYFFGGSIILKKSDFLRKIRIVDIEKKQCIDILKYAVPLVPNELSWSVLHFSDRMIISMFISLAANGIIAVASKLSVIYTMIFSVFNASWTEQVFLIYKKEEGREYIAELLEQFFVFFGAVASLIISSMPLVFRLLISEEYSSSYDLIPIYMIAVYFNVIIGGAGAIYLANHDTKIIAFTTCIAALINLFVDFVLVKKVGIFAAPISSICGYAVIAIWRIVDIDRRYFRFKICKKSIMKIVSLFLLSLFSYWSENYCIYFLISYCNKKFIFINWIIRYFTKRYNF